MQSTQQITNEEIVDLQASFYSVRKDSSGIHWQQSTGEIFIDRLSSSKESWLERMWNPTVLFHKQIAVVWTPYDFYRNEQYSHCGIDAFNLLKTDDGWKIAGISYTIEFDGAIKSPFGPPDFK